MVPPNNEELPFSVIFSNLSARSPARKPPDTHPRPANAPAYSTFHHLPRPAAADLAQGPAGAPDPAATATDATYTATPAAPAAPAAPGSSSALLLRPPPGPRPFSQPARLASTWRAYSYSSSVEADDERSTSSAGFDSEFGGDMATPGPRDRPGWLTDADERALALALPKPRYPGDDTRSTSPKELRGWYAYGFASEVYMICGISSFIPILLESLARENGVLASDKTTPCGSSSSRRPDGGGDGQCVVYILGAEINTASFTMYTFSISTLLQALLVVSISCAADHGNYRKKLLLAFAAIGSLSVMAYVFVTKEVFVLGAVLAIVSNTAFGASFVLLNSFLPLLVRNHPSVRLGEWTTPVDSDPEEDRGFANGNRGSEVDDDEENPDSTAVLLASGPANPSSPSSVAKQTSLKMSLSTQISAYGLGISYTAALFLQCVSIAILIYMHNAGTWAVRVVLFIIGTWWAVFTLPAAAWLRPRPGPPLPELGKGAGGKGSNGRRWMWLGYVAQAWRLLFRTVMLARRLVDIVLFLAAWFLLSDAVATTSNTAVLFAKTTLRMEAWALGLINVISTLAGVVGAFAWTAAARRLHLRPHHAVLAIIALFELIPLYGLLGYLPIVRDWGFLGLQQPWEMYPLAAVYGLVLGGLGAYCRALFGELIPPGSEAAFYALYAITDKGSSVFGPAIVAAIIDASGNIRPAFWFLAALVGLPAPLIWFVDVDRGKAEAERLADVIGSIAKTEGAGANGHHGENGRSSRRDEDGDEEQRRLFTGFDQHQDDG